MTPQDSSPSELQIAFQYLLKGTGWHDIVHPTYERILVRAVAALQELEGVGQQSGVLEVAFYANGERTHKIEFAALHTGTVAEQKQALSFDYFN